MRVDGDGLGCDLGVQRRLCLADKLRRISEREMERDRMSSEAVVMSNVCGNGCQDHYVDS